jgi:hypothetical protein
MMRGISCYCCHLAPTAIRFDVFQDVSSKTNVMGIDFRTRAHS